MNNLEEIKKAINYNPIKTFIAITSDEESYKDPDELCVYDANFGNETFEITRCRPQHLEKWEHLLVRPNLHSIPSYEAMAKIASAFFQDELAMQVIPKRCNYVSNEECTLHLWNMQTQCKFNFNDIYNHLFYLFYHNNFKFNFDNGICIKLCQDIAPNNCVAIITENRWPSWEEIVQAKEKVLGTQIDAIIINQGFKKDVQMFERCKYKIVLIWDASEIKLPDKSLV